MSNQEAKRNCRVAIIDDEFVFAEALATKLGRIDIAAQHFSRASSFFESDEISEVELAVVDLTMLDSNDQFWEFAGVEVVKKLRSQFGETITIWVLTSHDNPHLLHTCHINGADGFLTKDAGPTETATKIAKRLNQATVHAKDAAPVATANAAQ